MPIPDAQTLGVLHSAFLRRMEERSDGEPFVNFGHTHFVEDEVHYKQDIQALANNELQFGRWTRRDIGKGVILDAYKKDV